MRFIMLDTNNKVTSIRYGDEIIDGEIRSDIGELGQIMQADGTFITPEPEPVEQQETLEEKIDRLERQIQEDSIVQFEVLATIYEEILMKG